LTDLWAEVDDGRRVAPLGDGGSPAAEQVDGLAHGLERRRRVHLAARPHCRRLLAATCGDAADGALRLRRHSRHRGRPAEERSTAALPQR